MSREAIADMLAHHVSAPPPISPEVLAAARRHIIDTVGVMLAGARERCTLAVLATVSESQGVSSARSLVARKRVSVRDAAICNGIAGHAHDFDDDEPHVIVGHPSVAVVAALMALADTNALTMGTLSRAYLIGTETMLRVGALVNPRHYNDGWHCTATLGVLGAAAACAHVMGLDEVQTANAINIATTFASGLKENFGTDGKPLQTGAAAGNGLWACQLAAACLEGSTSALGGKLGFIAMNGGVDTLDVVESFGQPWGIATPGFNVKMYPCCSSTHTALDAVLELREHTAWSSSDIETIDVWIGPDVPAILVHDVPGTGLEAKFSMRYCLAYATVYGRIGFDAFKDAALRDPLLTAVLGRTRVHIDAQLPREATGVTHQSRVRWTSRNGESVECSHSLPRGSAQRPCTALELEQKFVACVSHGMDAQTAQRVWECIRGLTDADPASRLLDAIQSGARA